MHQNCNTCRWHQSTERVHSSPRQCPTTCHTTNTSKVEWIGLQSFASSTMFTWPLTNPLSLLQASWQFFAEKTLPQPAGGRKSFPRALQILKLRFLCYRNKQTFLIGKNVLIVMLPILINKDVCTLIKMFAFYGLKCMVWNHNYFCTNLMHVFYWALFPPTFLFW